MKIRAFSPDHSQINYKSLQPLTTHQFVLTLANPLFDPVNVTLATPPKTPGRFASTVTILCPQFEISANADAWDEALSTSGGGVTKKRRPGEQPQAGVVWEVGRNWVSVILEVVPASLESLASLGLVPSADGAAGDDADEELEEDEDVVQIPVFVRLEYETDVAAEESGLAAGSAEKGKKERREHAYWVVLGVGRIGRIGRRASQMLSPRSPGTPLTPR